MSARGIGTADLLIRMSILLVLALVIGLLLVGLGMLRSIGGLLAVLLSLGWLPVALLIIL